MLCLLVFYAHHMQKWCKKRNMWYIKVIHKCTTTSRSVTIGLKCVVVLIVMSRTLYSWIWSDWRRSVESVTRPCWATFAKTVQFISFYQRFTWLVPSLVSTCTLVLRWHQSYLSLMRENTSHMYHYPTVQYCLINFVCPSIIVQRFQVIIGDIQTPSIYRYW